MFGLFPVFEEKGGPKHKDFTGVRGPFGGGSRRGVSGKILYAYAFFRGLTLEATLWFKGTFGLARLFLKKTQKIPWERQEKSGQTGESPSGKPLVSNPRVLALPRILPFFLTIFTQCPAF